MSEIAKPRKKGPCGTCLVIGLTTVPFALAYAAYRKLVHDESFKEALDLLASRVRKVSLLKSQLEEAARNDPEGT